MTSSEHTPRTIVLTGASDGIGTAAVRTLANRGDRVIAVGRSRAKTAAVAREAGAEPLTADFARLDDVRALAEQVAARTDRVDVLVNNAGAVLGRRALTVDGHEGTLQVNHLAPFLLTHLLRDRLTAAGRATVVTTSSAAHRFGRLDLDDLDHTRGYTPNRAYGRAKLANILFTRGLHDRWYDDGVRAVAFHPGMVATNFAASSGSWFRLAYRTPLRRLLLTTSEEGGSYLTWFVDGEPGRTWEPGEYYDLRRHVPVPETADTALVDGLWELSAERVGVSG